MTHCPVSFLALYLFARWAASFPPPCEVADQNDLRDLVYSVSISAKSPYVNSCPFYIRHRSIAASGLRIQKGMSVVTYTTI